MKKLLLITFLTACILGCQDKDKKEDSINQSELDERAMDLEDDVIDNLELGCYVYKLNGNDLKIEVTRIEGDAVNANLYYAYAEKDKNTGTFSGNLHGDILLGKYTFMSEGTESVRDVAFKVENGQLVEGFGDLEESGTKFKDVTNITYSTTTPWKKADCY